MKKILILLAGLLLLGAGYFTYDKWVRNPDPTIWSFVPQNALLVYESAVPLQTLQEVRETGIWKNVGTLPFLSGMSRNLQVLDSIIGPGAFSSSFGSNPALFSLHTISSSEFDFLFIVEIQNLTQHAFISKMQTVYTKKTRQYLGFTITELKSADDQETFTFIFYKKFLIGSFTAFLVEDAIRAVDDENILPFVAKFPELQQVTKLEQDQGNLYVNFERMEPALSAFSSQIGGFNLGKSAFLDLKITDDLINLSGFTFLDKPDQLLIPFRQQSGGSFNMPEVVPNETASLLHYHFADAKRFGTELSTYFSKTDPKIAQLRATLLQENDLDVAFTFNLIDEEIGLAKLESANPEKPDMLLILEIKDMGEALNFFNSVGERDAATRGDSTYVEYFGNYQIRKLPYANFPYALLGDPARDFDHAFYIQHRNYLIFSNSLLRLKNLTLSIENENIWSKSLGIRRFLNQVNQSANLSYFVNTSRSWSGLKASLKEGWSAHADQYQFTYKNVEFLSFQFSTIDDKFYTNFSAFQPDVPDDRFPQQTEVQESITMAQALISKPQLITNHITREKEIVVQDSAYNLYQFSSTFDILWSVEVNEPIISEITQLDYYRNGKLQIAFATPNAVHIIDRNGDYLPGYPKPRLSENPIAYFKCIDYDNSKNYRLAITDSKGLVFLTDKDMRPLPGWNPRRFDEPLRAAPNHHRIGGKDVFTILLKSGRVHLLSRKGEDLGGFPIDLQSNLAKGYFLKESNDLKSSVLHTLTESGELIKINLLGEILQRDQLYKPDQSTRFSIIPNVAQSEFLILRQTENRYEVLNESGSILFTKDYFAGKPVYQQYYNLGADTRLLAFVDPVSAYLYLYDLSGTLITGRPLAATRPISLWKNGSEFQIYRCNGQNLELITLSF